VTLTSDVRRDKARLLGSDIDVDGVDPATITRVFNFRWKEGSDASLAALGASGAIITKKFADDHNLKIGSSLSLTTPNGSKAVFRVTGVHDPPTAQLDSPLAKVAISKAAFDARFPRPKNSFTFVNVAGGESAQTTAALKTSVAGFSDAKVATKASWVDTRASGINKILNIFYVLLGLSVLISLFGMVNALVLAVFERTREFGMMRAIGLTRGQARRMVRHESVITALIGACLGLPLGIVLAAVITRALHTADLTFSLPILALLLLALVAVLAGIAAAALPARRASRLNVLEALHYE
jgi:putative ABC transport system permease protein